MRTKIVRTGAVVLAALLMSCAGYGPRHPEPEMPLPPGVVAAPKGLKFSVKITPTRFKIGETVKLEATMFNDSEKTFHQKFATGCQWDYEIANEAGEVLGPGRMCTQAFSELTLEPGELRMIVREWPGRERYFGVHEPLSPGFYKVTAGLLDEYQRVIPMADPLTIEVIPR